MNTPMFICKFVELSPDEQLQMARLKEVLRTALDQPHGLGKVMTMLAHADPDAIDQARMWLDNAEGADGSPLSSIDIVNITGFHRVIGSPEFTD